MPFNIPRRPIYTAEEARDYARECAKDCLAWVSAGAWQTGRPAPVPDLLEIPGPFWTLFIETFRAVTGIHPGEMALRAIPPKRPRSWIDKVEDELRIFEEQVLGDPDLYRAWQVEKSS